MATRRGTFADALYKMEVGEAVSFPIKDLCRVRSGASAYGAQWERKYTTQLCREQHSVIVTREA